MQVIFRVRFSHLHSSRKNFRIYLFCFHLLDLSVTIQMLSPCLIVTLTVMLCYRYTDSYAILSLHWELCYLIVTLTVMLDSWKEFNIAVNTTKKCDELKDESTPLGHSILVPNSVKPETIFPILNPQNLNTENRFMYNKILQCFRPTLYWLSVAFHHIFQCFTPTRYWLLVAFHHISQCFTPIRFWLSVAFHHIFRF